ncbi:hydrolase [Chloroflexota bacterium]
MTVNAQDFILFMLAGGKTPLPNLTERGKAAMSLPTGLTTENAALVVIDIQDRMMRVMNDKERLLQNLQKLVKGMRVLEVPVILTEQYPAGLGPTLPELAQLLPDIRPIEKLSFSCWGEDRFRQELEALKRQQVIIAGIEAHVCVYQTAMDLSRLGYEVHVAADCVSSRETANKEVCLAQMSGAGISLTTTEMALFELLRVAQGDKFKQISNIVK